RPPIFEQVRPELADMLRLMDRLHFRQFGQTFQFGLGRFALHAPDGEMHPYQRHGRQHEQQHEAACPYAGEIVEGAKGDRQDETAKSADHADETTDRADIVRIVDRDMLVDRSLAEAHEKAEHEGQCNEYTEPDLHVERNRTADALYDIF